MVKKLSIVIISLNEEKNIGRLLKSIKKQKTSFPYEVILADNNSKDRTREIARRFGVKIVKGGLPAAGRNAGARHAKGDVILFLDADTILPEGFIEKNVKEFEKKNLAMATSLITASTKRSIHRQMIRVANRWVLLTAGIYPQAFGFCIFVKKSLHQKINGFNEKIKWLDDVNYTRRAVRHGKFGVVQSVPIVASLRRFEKEGTIKRSMLLAIILALTAVVGDEKADIFNYEFNYDKKSVSRRRKILAFAKKEARMIRKLLLSRSFSIITKARKKL